MNGNNIIGKFNPAAQRRILLSAHWDSRPFTDSPITVGDKNRPVLGADDGASGVGVLLEIARQLQLNPVDFGVDLVFFDLEDYLGFEPTTKAVEGLSKEEGIQEWVRRDLKWKSQVVKLVTFTLLNIVSDLCYFFEWSNIQNI